MERTTPLSMSAKPARMVSMGGDSSRCTSERRWRSRFGSGWRAKSVEPTPSYAFHELRFGRRQDVALAGHPDVESRQQEDAHGEIGYQSAHDDDRERPLRIRSDGMRERRG